eukprot:CAMPEP_0198262506 /NCGR_PEP_ID=MMETSP1447-20131203/10999_1 /TAXON_ID=420782 /ORGANISM="Chaetoceros dichaeta, Strain CCMP1751" /LENGTH=89 /DNA_ID=CAMNT_0043950767 /DNA_START=58 /DNA_END=327 /DNA_ORIENTATION=+
MASIIEKVVSPAFYQGKVNNLMANAGAYYRPLFRAGSVKPLWHMMIFTSTIMYTSTYLCLKGEKVQHERAVQKVAMDEYYKKHGITPGH